MNRNNVKLRTRFCNLISKQNLVLALCGVSNNWESHFQQPFTRCNTDVYQKTRLLWILKMRKIYIYVRVKCQQHEALSVANKLRQNGSSSEHWILMLLCFVAFLGSLRCSGLIHLLQLLFNRQRMAWYQSTATIAWFNESIVARTDHQAICAL